MQLKHNIEKKKTDIKEYCTHRLLDISTYMKFKNRQK